MKIFDLHVFIFEFFGFEGEVLSAVDLVLAGEFLEQVGDLGFVVLLHLGPGEG